MGSMAGVLLEAETAYTSRPSGVTPFLCDSRCPSFSFLFFCYSSCVPVSLDCPFLIVSLVFSNVF